MEYPVWGSLGYPESGFLSKQLYVCELRVRVLQIFVRSTVFMDGSHKSTCKLLAHFHGCDGDDDDDDYCDDDDDGGDAGSGDGVGSDDRLQRWS